MLRSLVAILGALLDLVEAEARAARRAARRIGMAVAFTAIGAGVMTGLALAGTGFLVWSLYLWLAALLPPAGAALVAGGALWFAVGLLALMVALQARR